MEWLLSVQPQPKLPDFKRNVNIALLCQMLQAVHFPKRPVPLGPPQTVVFSVSRNQNRMQGKLFHLPWLPPNATTLLFFFHFLSFHGSILFLFDGEMGREPFPLAFLMKWEADPSEGKWKQQEKSVRGCRVVTVGKLSRTTDRTRCCSTNIPFPPTRSHRIRSSIMAIARPSFDEHQGNGRKSIERFGCRWYTLAPLECKYLNQFPYVFFFFFFSESQQTLPEEKGYGKKNETFAHRLLLPSVRMALFLCHWSFYFSSSFDRT